MSEEEGMQQDLEEQERLALDCLRVVYEDGHEGTAAQLARLLGLTQQFQQEIRR
jgi:hypothetical protein